MAIVFTCPRCDKQYSVSEAMAGRRATCKQCGQEQTIPKPRSTDVLEEFDEVDDEEIEQEQIEAEYAPVQAAPPRRTPAPVSSPSVGAHPKPVPRRRSTSSSFSLESFGRPLAILAVVAAIGAGAFLVANGTIPLWTSGDTAKSRQVAQNLRDYVVVCDDTTRAIEGIVDAASAQAAGPRMLELSQRNNAIKARVREVGNLTKAEEKHLKTTVGPDIVASLSRLRVALLQKSNMPGNPAAMAAMLSSIDREMNMWKNINGDGIDAGGGGSGASTPETTITVDAKGIDDPIARELFGKKLQELAARTSGQGNAGMNSRVDGQITRYEITPVSDVETFSKGIDFGNVTKTSGRTVSVTASLNADELDALRKEKSVEIEAKAKRDEEFKARMATAKAERDAETNADTSTIDGALAALKTVRSFKLQEAIKRLAVDVPEDRKAEVVAALSPLVNEKDFFTVKTTVETLTALKHPAALEPLVAVLDRSDVGRYAIEALGKIRDPRAAAPLAERIESAWPAANKALIAIGPGAESAVLPLLRSPESRVRALACEVLEEIGGTEALATMKKLPADPDFGVQVAARKAMQQISLRTKSQK